MRESFIWNDLWRVRNMRPAFARGFLAGAALAGAATVSGGRLPPRSLPVHADADTHMRSADRSPPAQRYDGTLTFDKLSSVYLSGNTTRDDAPNHIRIQRVVAREVAETWVSMCPAQVYEIGGDPAEGGEVTVEVTPSNCIQCGAISAKGGRLTVAEGGDGPDYAMM